MEKISHDDFYLVIGKLAVKLKFICEEQLQEALLILNARKRAGQQLFLGEIMVLIEMLSQSQLDFLLSAQKIISLVLVRLTTLSRSKTRPLFLRQLPRQHSKPDRYQAKS